MAALVLGLAGWHTAGAAPPDPISAARALRLQGCESHAGSRAPLRSSAALPAAAAQWSHGLTLKAALERSGYRDVRSSGMHMSGSAQALTAALAKQLCAPLSDPALIDIGAFERGSDTWIILAAPFTAPSPAAGENIAAQMLRLVNAARAEPRHCGRSLMAAAPALRLNELLNGAALLHAQDMLRYDYFEHTGHDGSSPAQRVADAGYRYRLIGENIASGPETPQEALQGWLASPAHCQNLMDARFGEMGVGFAASRSGAAHIYWVQEFAVAR